MKLSELFEKQLEPYPGTDIEAHDLWVKSGGDIRLNMNNVLYAVTHLRMTQSKKNILCTKVDGGYEFKYQLEIVNGDLRVNHENFVSFKNFPLHIKGNCECEINNISSLEGMPEIIEGLLDLASNPITSFKDINKHLKTCWTMCIPQDLTSNILGLLEIKKLGYIYVDPTIKNHPNIKTLTTVCNIVNKYLKSNRDIFECKEELINAGFKEYAKL